MKNVLQLQPFYLNAPLGATDITIQVRGLKDSRGTAITSMPSGVTEIIVTIEPQSTNNQEIISFTGITDNGNGIVTLTGVTRNLSPTDVTVVLSATVPHANNATCIVSDSPQALRKVLVTDEVATITAVHNFSVSPTVPNATSANEPVSKSQLDLAVIGTVPASSTTVLGAVRVATDPTKTLGTATMTIASPCVVSLASHGLTANDTIRFTTTGALPTGLTVGTTYYVLSTGLTSGTFQLSLTAGGTAITTTGTQSGVHTLYRTTPYAINDQDTRLLKFATDAGASDAYAINILPVPTAYTNGMFITFRANTANTGASTLNVNGLGAKNIVKNFNQTLADNDIKVNQTVTVVYESTTDTFQMVSQLGNLPTQSVDIQAFTTAGTTSWTKPTNAKWVEVTVIGGGAGGSSAGGFSPMGGGGGGYGFQRFDASVLGATETVVVGAGGAGTTSAPATNGGFSTFGTSVLLRANGGSAGTGGSAGIGAVKANGSISYAGGNGGSSGGSGVDTATDPSPRGGAAGNGGNGGGFITNYVKAGGVAGNPGVAGSSTAAGLLYGGVGGGGGNVAAAAGGNGGFPGGGGGGGGGSGAGAGGNGAQGMVYVVTYF